MASTTPNPNAPPLTRGSTVRLLDLFSYDVSDISPQHGIVLTGYLGAGVELVDATGNLAAPPGAFFYIRVQQPASVTTPPGPGIADQYVRIRPDATATSFPFYGEFYQHTYVQGSQNEWYHNGSYGVITSVRVALNVSSAPAITSDGGADQASRSIVENTKFVTDVRA